MNTCLDPAVGRFKGLDEEVREEFRKTLIAFRNLYAFMSQVIPFQDSDLEKLYSYIRFLLTKLPKGDRGPIYNFDDDVALKYYRLQKISEGSINLEAGKLEPVSGPTAVGTGIARGDEIELSRLIDILNERFGTEFKLGDQLFFDSIREDVAISAERDRGNSPRVQEPGDSGRRVERACCRPRTPPAEFSKVKNRAVCPSAAQQESPAWDGPEPHESDGCNSS